MNAIPPNTRDRSCWCPRCAEEGTFQADALTGVVRLVCGDCGFPSAPALCDTCGTSSVIEQPTLQPGGTWKCAECGQIHDVAADYFDNAIVFALRHRGEEAPPRVKTGKDAWRGVIRMMLGLAVFIWIYYQ